MDELIDSVIHALNPIGEGDVVRIRKGVSIETLAEYDKDWHRVNVEPHMLHEIDWDVLCFKTSPGEYLIRNSSISLTWLLVAYRKHLIKSHEKTL